MKSANALLAAWPSTAESREAMKRALVQHINGDIRSRLSSDFKRWFERTENAQRAMEKLPPAVSPLALVDMFARALQRYLNFNPDHDVETLTQAKARKKHFEETNAIIRDHNLMHPDQNVQTAMLSGLHYLSVVDHLPDRLVKNHEKADRQLFIRTLGSELLKYLGQDSALISPIICDLVAIIAEPVNLGQARNEINMIRYERTGHRAHAQPAPVRTARQSLDHSLFRLHGEIPFCFTTNYDRLLESALG